MHFCQIYNHPALILNGTEIPINQEYKFQGITLDPKLSFIPQYQMSEDKMQPNHPSPESHGPHKLRRWQKDPNQILQIPNMIKFWLWLIN